MTESEALSYHYELDLRPVTFPDDPQNIPSLTPDPRVSHTLNLSTDQYGNVLQSIAAGYGRVRPFNDPDYTQDQVNLIRNVQAEQHLSYSETHYTNDAIQPASGTAREQHYRLRMLAEAQTYELTGFTPASGFYFDLADLRTYHLTAADEGSRQVEEIEYQEISNPNIQQKRKVEHVRTLYFNEDLKTPLAPGVLNHLGLAYENYKLALTETLLESVLGNKFNDTVRNVLDDPSVCGYSSVAAKQWWQRSGVAGFADDAADHFYLPERYTDPFGNETTLSYDGKYDLFIQSSTDALGNQTRIFADQFDYRVLAPTEVEDINGNRTEVFFDVLGMVVATAIKGKGAEADNLDGYTDDFANPDLIELLNHFNLPPLTADQMDAHFTPVLGNATTRCLYHFGEEIKNGKTVFASRPSGACTIAREQHVAQLEQDSRSRLQIAFECSDGSGSVLLKRNQAEPESAGGPLRWIVNGKTVFNNKGKPVKQYEPYFSQQSTCRAEGDKQEEAGVTPLMYYDALERLIRTEMPDGTLTRVEYSLWQVKTFDANDTAVESQWYRERNPPPPEAPLPRDPITGQLTVSPEQRAAWLVAQHFNTPVVTIVDSLGRNAITIAHNRVKDPSGSHVFGGENYRDERYFTFTKLDAEGKPLWIRDARGNLVMQYITPTKPTRRADDPTENVPARSVPCYDIAGNLLFQHSMDAGDRWMLSDAAGKPAFAWDFNQQQDDAGTVTGEARLFVTRYDELHRPIERWLTINKGEQQLIERFTYGERLPDAQERNLRGRLHEHFDQSGLSQVERADFKGNVVERQRQLASHYKAPVIDWQVQSSTSELESETFTYITEFDALNRPARIYNWHRGDRSRVAVYEPTYSERGVLVSETLDVGATKTDKGHEPSRSGPTNAIVEIRYDAKGQKTSSTNGNQTVTTYDYDPMTFRLVQLRTTRPVFAKSGLPILKDANVLQDLQYTYDPVGNTTEIRDDAFQPAFFQNQVVDAVSRYTYDAIYRLTESTGRENFQASGAPRQFEDDPSGVQFPVTTADVLRNYTQIYNYDSVGNIRQMRHVAAVRQWTRTYESALDSNRLLRTWEGSDPIGAIQYRFDAHGNMLNLENVAGDQSIRWDYRDMIRALNLMGGGWAYYNYDIEKQRTRKVIESQKGTKQWERIYLGGFEIYRRYSGGNIVEEIESIHLMSGDRLLLVDDVLRTDNARLPAATLYRYQYNNHLGSACAELNQRAEIISYEEYHPYGTSAYRATNNGLEAPPKRYRYTGMERDEESGLSYHAARYYLAWLGKWSGPDPLDTLNRYAFSSNNPIKFVDLDGRAPRCAGMTACTYDPENINDAVRLIQLHNEYFKGRWDGFSPAEQKELDSQLADQIAEENYAKVGPQGFKEKALVKLGGFVNSVKETRVGKAVGKADDWYEEQKEIQRDNFDRTVGEQVATGMLGTDRRPLNAVGQELARDTRKNALETVGPSLRAGGDAMLSAAMMVGDVKGGVDLAEAGVTGLKKLASLKGAAWRRLGLEFEEVAMDGLRSSLRGKYLNYMDEQRTLARVVEKAGEKVYAMPEAAILNGRGDFLAIFDAKIGQISVGQGKVYVDSLVNSVTKKPTGVLYYISPDGARQIPSELAKYAASKGVHIEQLRMTWAPSYIPRK